MSWSRTEIALAGSIAAAPVVVAAFFPALSFPAAVLVTAIAAGAIHLTRNRPEHALYIAAAGLLSVVACGEAVFLAGIPVFWMLAALVALRCGLVASRRDAWVLVIFCCCTGLIGAGLSLASHAAVPLPAMGGIAILLLIARAAREYRFRKGLLQEAPQ